MAISKDLYGGEVDGGGKSENLTGKGLDYTRNIAKTSLASERLRRRAE